MSTINQCTFALTGKTKLVQYYRECYTCSNEHLTVEVCLHCASICHENHQLGPLLREKFSCECQQVCQACRALPPVYDEDSILPPSMHKKRKFNQQSTRYDNNKQYWIVWSKRSKDKKVLVSSHTTVEEANEKAKTIFRAHNPFEYEIEEFEALPYTMKYSSDQGIQLFLLDETDLQNTTRSSSTSPLPDAWRVGVTRDQDFLKEFTTFESLCSSSSNHPRKPTTPPEEPKKKALRLEPTSTSKAMIHEEDETEEVNAWPVETVSYPQTDDRDSPFLPASVISTISRVSSSYAPEMVVTSIGGKTSSPLTLALVGTPPAMNTLIPTTTTIVSSKATTATMNPPTSGKKTTRPKKEVGAPKGPSASYIFYSNAMREKIQSQHPGMAMVDVSRTIGQLWKELPQEERTPFEDLAKVDRARYAKEMEFFKEKKKQDLSAGISSSGHTVASSSMSRPPTTTTTNAASSIKTHPTLTTNNRQSVSSSGILSSPSLQAMADRKSTPVTAASALSSLATAAGIMPRAQTHEETEMEVDGDGRSISKQSIADESLLSEENEGVVVGIELQHERDEDELESLQSEE